MEEPDVGLRKGRARMGGGRGRIERAAMVNVGLAVAPVGKDTAAEKKEIRMIMGAQLRHRQRMCWRWHRCGYVPLHALHLHIPRHARFGRPHRLENQFADVPRSSAMPRRVKSSSR